MVLTRRGVLVAGLVISAGVGGSLFGASLARGNQTPPVSAFASTSAATATDQTEIQGLADDVGDVAPGAPNHEGKPLTGEARDLITNAGASHDTLGAFPTSSGEVCFEVSGAGTCGDPNNGEPFGAGIIFGILSTRNGGTRVYGVASDKVAKVDVEIGGSEYPATLNNNGFYYALPGGVSSDQIQNVISTWKDGSAHTFPVHP